MKHLKEISQKPQMRLLDADFSLKKSIKVFSSIFY